MIKSRFLAAFALPALLLTLRATTAQAQNPASYYEEIPRLFSAGIIVGGNATQVDGDNYAGYHKFGLNLGGVAYAHFSDHVAASIEILYSQKGSRGHFAQLSTNRAFSIRKYNIALNYAEIPLQIHYFDQRKSHFSAGFSASRLISSKETATTEPVQVVDFEPYPFRKMDYNIVAGGSLHLWEGLYFQARFQYSLRPIRENDLPVEFSGRNQQFNNMWTVRLMYLFD
jgi:hypothetical protein